MILLPISALSPTMGRWAGGKLLRPYTCIFHCTLLVDLIKNVDCLLYAVRVLPQLAAVLAK